ncbi:MAG: phosphatidate cytidylyltransferase [Acidobacteriota bacterium]
MKRILTASILIPIIVWTVLFAPYGVFLLVMALVGLGAFREYDRIAAAHGLAPSGWLGMAAGVVFLVSPLVATPLLIALTGVLMAVQLRLDDFAKALPSAGAAVLGVVYIFGGWHCALLLREESAHWLMIALAVSWAGDTAAMYVGKTWGKHKLAPSVSPGKTREGGDRVGGRGGALTAAIYAHYFLPGESLATALVVGAIGNIAGQIGDLSESAFKRGAGMKDSGTMLPGHGGWLDRIDSTLFSVPAVYVSLLVLHSFVAAL